jgi:uncharacterized protein YqgC (DUF456 family)
VILPAAWLFALAAVLVVAGVAGTVLPVLPGPPLVFAGLLLAAWADGFQRVGWPSLVVLGLLTLLTLAIDLLSASWGARQAKASPWALVGAALGGLLGIFAGLPGLVLGPFVGAVAGEYWARRELAGAGRAGLAAWLGLVVGGALKLAVVAAMLGWFAVAFFF